MTSTTHPLIINAADVSQASWSGVVEALRSGHQYPRATIKDLHMTMEQGNSLTRAAAISGLGSGVKSVTVFPSNAALTPPKPSVQGAYLLFDGDDGALKAIIDGALITYWKTAGDSMLGAQLLANPDPTTVLVIGSGVLAGSLVEAYCALFSTVQRVQIWSRTVENAEKLAAAKQHLATDSRDIIAIEQLPEAATVSDLISTATMATAPILHNEWIAPGTHIDLIGAYRPDMREADDALISQHTLCVDARETTIEEIGELMIPIANGVITADDVRADFYELIDANPIRTAHDGITVFKNGGGAHLDLMIADYLYGLVADRDLAMAESR